MNVPVLIVAIIMVFVVAAHVLGGTRETAAIAPDPADTKRTTHWIQAMAAFQMLSIDLLAMTAALFAIALADLGPYEPQITRGLAGIFALWGIVWIAQILWSAKSTAILFRLPHWIVWFVCAALLLWGA